ncbi:MAG TPA: hypothetical protein VIO58_07550 [Candidatus Methanoperedens sp.]
MISKEADEMMIDPTTGKELEVGEVWSGSLSIIWHKPIVLLPIFIVLVFELLLGLLTRSFIVLPEKITSTRDLMPYLPSLLPALFITFILVYIIAYPVFVGMYPLLVKNTVEKKELDLKTAFRSAVKKAPVLISVNIILILVILAGLLFFIIPGVIFSIWYFYAIPVIMLENRSVVNAMKASKTFSRDKKFKTFLIFLIPFLMLVISQFFVRLISAVILFMSGDAMYDILPVIAAARAVIDFLALLFFISWLSVIPAYVYLKYGKDGLVEGSITNE